MILSSVEDKRFDCFQVFSKNEKGECLHRFHAGCLRGWIRKGGRSCPTCRAYIKYIRRLKNGRKVGGLSQDRRQRTTMSDHARRTNYLGKERGKEGEHSFWDSVEPLLKTFIRRKKWWKFSTRWNQHMVHNDHGIVSSMQIIHLFSRTDRDQHLTAGFPPSVFLSLYVDTHLPFFIPAYRREASVEWAA